MLDILRFSGLPTNSLILLGCAFFFLLGGIEGCSKPLVKSSPVIRSPLPSETPQTRKIPAQEQKPKGEVKKQDRKERPYAVNGTWYFPISSVAAYREKGVCSWYGPDFHGKPTSSGEIYDMHDLTAAHRLLPYNTQVRVTNPANGKEVIVRINDRGPFMKDRILDLSYAGAKALGILGPGTAFVELEALGVLEEVEENGERITRLVQEVNLQQSRFTVQVGAFKERQNALALKERLEKDYGRVEIFEIRKNGEPFFRVRLIDFPDLQEAIRIQKMLEGNGFIQALVVAE